MQHICQAIAGTYTITTRFGFGKIICVCCTAIICQANAGTYTVTPHFGFG